MSSSPSLKRSDTIADTMPDALRQSRYYMKKCFSRFVAKGKRLMKRHHLMDEVEKSIEDKIERGKVLEGLLGYILSSTQEAAVVPPNVAFAVRPNPGSWEYVKVNSEDLTVDGINVLEYLKFKETIFDQDWAKDENALELDFGAMDFSSPRLTLSSSIGNGVNYVSKFMSTRLSANSEKAKQFLDYLLALNHRGEQLMINDTLDTVDKLQAALIVAEVSISDLPKDTPYQEFQQRFKEWGFEKGWGNTAERVRETMRLFSEVLQAPDAAKLQVLFSRLPNMFNVVIFSPHGYFGQADVLGLPDTGGQVHKMFQASNVPIKVPEPLQSAQTAPVESQQPAAATGIAKPQPPASAVIDKLSRLCSDSSLHLSLVDFWVQTGFTVKSHGFWFTGKKVQS